MGLSHYLRKGDPDPQDPHWDPTLSAARTAFRCTHQFPTVADFRWGFGTLQSQLRCGLPNLNPSKPNY